MPNGLGPHRASGSGPAPCHVAGPTSPNVAGAAAFSLGFSAAFIAANRSYYEEKIAQLSAREQELMAQVARLQATVDAMVNIVTSQPQS